MSNARVKRRIITGAAAGLVMVATSMLTGASGASAHTAEQMELLAPHLGNDARGQMLANYLGGDGSLMRAYVNQQRSHTVAVRPAGVAAPTRFDYSALLAQYGR